MSERPTGTRDSARALAALALAVFAIGTTEFIVPGLLPEIATGIGASIPDAGLLVTGYALGVAVGGPVLVIATNAFSRKTTLLVLVVIFVIGHVMSAIAPSYGFLMASRVVTSFCHGAFVGVASVVAMQMVPADRRARAVAVVWIGFSMATIIGVPAGSALGHVIGWRWTILLVGALGLVSGIGIAAFVPGSVSGERADLRKEIRVLRRPRLLIALAMSVLLAGGTFSTFTFIVPFLIDVTGLSREAVPGVLFAFGIGGIIGMLTGARLADWKLMPATISIFAALAVTYLLMLLVQTSPSLMTGIVVIWGFLVYAPAAPIQVRIVSLASDGPNLASTLNQSAFNVGNAVGPFLGAAILSKGAGFGALPWLGFVMLTFGTGLGLVGMALDLQEKRRLA
jgi:DHA1 family inner membrane transport protein